MLRVAATLERGSEHPLAAAILEGAAERGATPGDAKDFESVTGRGVRALVDDSPALLGSGAFLEKEGIDVGGLAERADGLRREAPTGGRRQDEQDHHGTRSPRGHRHLQGSGVLTGRRAECFVPSAATRLRTDRRCCG